jgi:nicotinate-nucleotide adenylyltransferase
MNVAFYGGSFDPPHAGHVLAAAYLTSVVGFDKVLVVPVFHHAFDKPLTDYQARLAMCRTAFERLCGVEISTIESELAAPSYTITTVLALLRGHPDWNLRVIVGADVLPDIERWNRIDELQRIAPLYVLGRRGAQASPVAPAALLPEISSTQVRQLCAAPKSAETDEALQRLVPKRVVEAIRAWRLYQNT